MRRQAIEALLPALFRRAVATEGGVASALLDVMESLHTRPVAILDDLDAFFDPRRTPDAFVPYLGQWVDLDRFYDTSFRSGDETRRVPISSGLGQLRELIHSAAYLSRWRGTRAGLVAFLETATGITGFEVSDEVPGEGGRILPFHIRVGVPEAARPHTVLVQRVIESEKPAYVTYDMQFIS